MPKITKGHNSWSIFQNFFKSYSGHLLITTNPFTKFQGSSSNSFWDILLTRYKCPKLQRAITQEVFFKISSKVNQFVYSSLPVYLSSFKALALILFEIFCWQDCINIFSKDRNSEKGQNPVKKKKYLSAIFSWGIHIRNFKTVAFTVLKLCYASNSVSDGRTNNSEAICTPPPSPNFFEVGGIMIILTSKTMQHV